MPIKPLQEIPSIWAALQTFSAGIKLGAAQAIKDSLGVDRIAIANAAPQISLTGTVQFTAATGLIRNSAAANRIRVAANGVQLDGNLGVGTGASATIKMTVIDTNAYSGFAAAFYVVEQGSQAANYVGAFGTSIFFLQANYDLAGFALTNFQGIFLQPVVQDTVGGGLVTNFAGLRLDFAGISSTYNTNIAGIDLYNVDNTATIAAGIRQRDTDIHNRFGSPIMIGADATPNPGLMADLAGGLATRRTAYTAANGNNNNIAIGNTAFVVITGPTAAFTITGIAGGVDGRRLTIVNKSGQNMTVANEHASSTAANRIDTLTGIDAATVGDGAADLIYDATNSRWLVRTIRG